MRGVNSGRKLQVKPLEFSVDWWHTKKKKEGGGDGDVQTLK